MNEAGMCVGNIARVGPHYRVFHTADTHGAAFDFPSLRLAAGYFNEYDATRDL
ncbi:hypothetical protein GCM10011399_16050 [Subtercola lobariae]|uniref:Uncharacterized protein n=2 Tax=Subtercola lobariae TaxID=1588641 RepID=A0A917B5F2_9MICO|nr:hypothetical protein GCM10011399_16050 [Subtercola lobariae]